jgi:hypothetical protein
MARSGTPWPGIRRSDLVNYVVYPYPETSAATGEGGLQREYRDYLGTDWWR